MVTTSFLGCLPTFGTVTEVSPKVAGKERKPSKQYPGSYLVNRPPIRIVSQTLAHILLRVRGELSPIHCGKWLVLSTRRVGFSGVSSLISSHHGK